VSAYLYPNLGSKKAFRDAIAAGKVITAMANYPSGSEFCERGTFCFEGPHYPKPHRFYGKATVENGRVVKVV
jgi:hypothetical protein